MERLTETRSRLPQLGKRPKGSVSEFYKKKNYMLKQQYTSVQVLVGVSDP